MSEVRGQKSETRGRWSKGRCQMTEDGGQRADDRGRVTEDGGQKTGKGKGFGNLRFRSTFDIIEAVEAGRFPDKVMINAHPQRWTDNPVAWGKELVWQNVKNVIKRAMLAYWDAGITTNAGMLECWNTGMLGYWN